MSAPTAEQLAKLPKWAQDHIRDLDRRREVAVRQMQGAADLDTPAPFFYEEMVCVDAGSPRTVRRYIQRGWIQLSHLGLEVELILRNIGRETVLDVKYGESQRASGGQILFQPRSMQQFYLYCPEPPK